MKHTNTHYTIRTQFVVHIRRIFFKKYSWIYFSHYNCFKKFRLKIEAPEITGFFKTAFGFDT